MLLSYDLCLLVSRWRAKWIGWQGDEMLHVLFCTWTDSVLVRYVVEMLLPIYI